MAAVLALGLIGVGVSLFAAFESYVLNINAHLEPVLDVRPHGTWNLGTIYPEKDYPAVINVALSTSANSDPNLKSLAYKISCNPTPPKLNMCTNMTWKKDGTAIDRVGPQPSGTQSSLTRSATALAKDTWDLDFVAPDCIGAHQKTPTGVKEVDCNLDPATGTFAGVDMGASIHIEVGQITQNLAPITNKAGCSVNPILPKATPVCPTPTPTPTTVPIA